MLTLVVGGVRSGKSAVAERLAASAGGPVHYVATYPRGDDAEMAERVRRHRERRPASWHTVEAPDPLGAFGDDLGRAGTGTILVDNLGGWLSALLPAGGGEPAGPTGGEAAPDPAGARERVAAFAAAACARSGEVIVVADETGLGGVAAHPVARAFADLSGEACQVLAEAAHRVLLVVAGQVLVVKGSPQPAAPWSAQGTPAGMDGEGALRFHGDREVPAGHLDFAVSVVAGGPPPPVRHVLEGALRGTGRYPDEAAATRALAAYHSRSPDEVLPLNGASEAFWLLASTLRARQAVCVHPSFTEPEAALRACGTPVARTFREAGGFRLRPEAVDGGADLVVLGNPNNPTGTLDPAAVVAGLARPGRILVVDEAFMDLAGGPPPGESMAGRGDLPGLVVIRSLTKLWGLPGVRAGYLLGPPEVVAALRARRQPWSVGTVALAALEAYPALARGDGPASPGPIAAAVARARVELCMGLTGLPGVQVWPSAANFLLVRVPGGAEVRRRLAERGIAVRRGDTFPGLSPDHLRVAVRGPADNARLVAALAGVLAEAAG